MDNSPFHIDYFEGDEIHTAEIRPCCRENNIVDYAVWLNDKLEFTITKNSETNDWVIAMKNADDDIDQALVNLIGEEIDNRSL